MSFLQSQQKCIVIFALVCCFAVLLALIFSAVDFWGEDEETEEECPRNCSIVLVENIPADMLFSDNSTFHLPLSMGLNFLLDKAQEDVEIVSPHLQFNGVFQGKDLLSKLQELKNKRIQLKISTGEFDSAELKALEDYHDAKVHKVNMTALTKGQLHSSFWVVDRKHFYIGSASMDWRSLATKKELGVVVYDCKPLALDLHKVFNLYWGLQYKTFVPTFWSKRLFPFFNKDKPGNLVINRTTLQTYISSSPAAFIPKDRSSDLEAISSVISGASHFIYISVIDYLPLLRMESYWSRIDGLLREALILRSVHVRLLISCWEETNPLTFNFIWSLKSLCMEKANCSLEAVSKFFGLQRDGGLGGMNHNRFMVTDKAIYIGNLDWVGEEFGNNAGAGLVISHPANVTDRNFTVVEQLRAVFERDWFSHYAVPLQANKTPVCTRQHVDVSVFSKASHAPYGAQPGRTGQDDNGPAPHNSNMHMYFPFCLTYTVATLSRWTQMALVTVQLSTDCDLC
uniref:Phospholipase D family member 5 n=1 Tax=Fundulus heteroclitus TaxID=8078 RepID=A0A3Q2QBV0_FUNHE